MGGNSLNELLASFYFSKRVLWIAIYQYIYLLIFHNLLQRKGRFKTRLFLHFFGGAISAATQIQLSVCASSNYKIIKGFGMKVNVVSLLPHFFTINSISSAFSCSSSLSSRQNQRVIYHKIK